MSTPIDPVTKIQNYRDKKPAFSADLLKYLDTHSTLTLFVLENNDTLTTEQQAAMVTVIREIIEWDNVPHTPEQEKQDKFLKLLRSISVNTKIKDFLPLKSFGFAFDASFRLQNDDLTQNFSQFITHLVRAEPKVHTTPKTLGKILKQKTELKNLAGTFLSATTTELRSKISTKLSEMNNIFDPSKKIENYKNRNPAFSDNLLKHLDTHPTLTLFLLENNDTLTTEQQAAMVTVIREIIEWDNLLHTPEQNKQVEFLKLLRSISVNTKNPRFLPLKSFGFAFDPSFTVQNDDLTQNFAQLITHLVHADPKSVGETLQQKEFLSRKLLKNKQDATLVLTTLSEINSNFKITPEKFNAIEEKEESDPLKLQTADIAEGNVSEHVPFADELDNSQLDFLEIPTNVKRKVESELVFISPETSSADIAISPAPSVTPDNTPEEEKTPASSSLSPNSKISTASSALLKSLSLNQAELLGPLENKHTESKIDPVPLDAEPEILNTADLEQFLNSGVSNHSKPLPDPKKLVFKKVLDFNPGEENQVEDLLSDLEQLDESGDNGEETISLDFLEKSDTLKDFEHLSSRLDRILNEIDSISDPEKIEKLIKLAFEKEKEIKDVLSKIIKRIIEHQSVLEIVKQVENEKNIASLAKKDLGYSEIKKEDSSPDNESSTPIQATRQDFSSLYTQLAVILNQIDSISDPEEIDKLFKLAFEKEKEITDALSQTRERIDKKQEYLEKIKKTKKEFGEEKSKIILSSLTDQDEKITTEDIQTLLAYSAGYREKTEISNEIKKLMTGLRINDNLFKTNPEYFSNVMIFLSLISTVSHFSSNLSEKDFEFIQEKLKNLQQSLENSSDNFSNLTLVITSFLESKQSLTDEQQIATSFLPNWNWSPQVKQEQTVVASFLEDSKPEGNSPDPSLSHKDEKNSEKLNPFDLSKSDSEMLFAEFGIIPTCLAYYLENPEEFLGEIEQQLATENASGLEKLGITQEKIEHLKSGNKLNFLFEYLNTVNEIYAPASTIVELSEKQKKIIEQFRDFSLHEPEHRQSVDPDIDIDIDETVEILEEESPKLPTEPDEKIREDNAVSSPDLELQIELQDVGVIKEEVNPLTVTAIETVNAFSSISNPQVLSSIAPVVMHEEKKDNFSDAVPSPGLVEVPREEVTPSRIIAKKTVVMKTQEEEPFLNSPLDEKDDLRKSEPVLPQDEQGLESEEMLLIQQARKFLEIQNQKFFSIVENGIKVRHYTGWIKNVQDLTKLNNTKDENLVSELNLALKKEKDRATLNNPISLQFSTEKERLNTIQETSSFFKKLELKDGISDTAVKKLLKLSNKIGTINIKADTEEASDLTEKTDWPSVFPDVDELIDHEITDFFENQKIDKKSIDEIKKSYKEKDLKRLKETLLNIYPKDKVPEKDEEKIPEDEKSSGPKQPKKLENLNKDYIFPKEEFLKKIKLIQDEMLENDPSRSTLEKFSKFVDNLQVEGKTEDEITKSFQEFYKQLPEEKEENLSDQQEKFLIQKKEKLLQFFHAAFTATTPKAYAAALLNIEQTALEHNPKKQFGQLMNVIENSKSKHPNDPKYKKIVQIVLEALSKYEGFNFSDLAIDSVKEKIQTELLGIGMESSTVDVFLKIFGNLKGLENIGDNSVIVGKIKDFGRNLEEIIIKASDKENSVKNSRRDLIDLIFFSFNENPSLDPAITEEFIASFKTEFKKTLPDMTHSEFLKWIETSLDSQKIKKENIQLVLEIANEFSGEYNQELIGAIIRDIKQDPMFYEIKKSSGETLSDRELNETITRLSDEKLTDEVFKSEILSFMESLELPEDVKEQILKEYEMSSAALAKATENDEKEAADSSDEPKMNLRYNALNSLKQACMKFGTFDSEIEKSLADFKNLTGENLTKQIVMVLEKNKIRYIKSNKILELVDTRSKLFAHSLTRTAHKKIEIPLRFREKLKTRAEEKLKIHQELEIEKNNYLRTAYASLENRRRENELLIESLLSTSPRLTKYGIVGLSLRRINEDSILSFGGRYFVKSPIQEEAIIKELKETRIKLVQEEKEIELTRLNYSMKQLDALTDYMELIFDPNSKLASTLSELESLSAIKLFLTERQALGKEHPEHLFLITQIDRFIAIRNNGAEIEPRAIQRLQDHLFSELTADEKLKPFGKKLHLLNQKIKAQLTEEIKQKKDEIQKFKEQLNQNGQPDHNPSDPRLDKFKSAIQLYLRDMELSELEIYDICKNLPSTLPELAKFTGQLKIFERMHRLSIKSVSSRWMAQSKANAIENLMDNKNETEIHLIQLPELALAENLFQILQARASTIVGNGLIVVTGTGTQNNSVKVYAVRHGILSESPVLSHHPSSPPPRELKEIIRHFRKKTTSNEIVQIDDYATRRTVQNFLKIVNRKNNGKTAASYQQYFGVTFKEIRSAYGTSAKAVTMSLREDPDNMMLKVPDPEGWQALYDFIEKQTQQKKPFELTFPSDPETPGSMQIRCEIKPTPGHSPPFRGVFYDKDGRELNSPEERARYGGYTMGHIARAFMEANPQSKIQFALLMVPSPVALTGAKPTPPGQGREGGAGVDSRHLFRQRFKGF